MGNGQPMMNIRFLRGGPPRIPWIPNCYSNHVFCMFLISKWTFLWSTSVQVRSTLHSYFCILILPHNILLLSEDYDKTFLFCSKLHCFSTMVHLTEKIDTINNALKFTVENIFNIKLLK